MSNLKFSEPSIMKGIFINFVSSSFHFFLIYFFVFSRPVTLLNLYDLC